MKIILEKDIDNQLPTIHDTHEMFSHWQALREQISDIITAIDILNKRISIMEKNNFKYKFREKLQSKEYKLADFLIRKYPNKINFGDWEKISEDAIKYINELE